MSIRYARNAKSQKKEKTMAIKNPMEIEIRELLHAIEDAANGEAAWLEHGPYIRILRAAYQVGKYLDKNVEGNTQASSS